MVESALGRELSFVGQDFSHNHSQRFASSNVRLLDYPVSVLSELEVASWLMHWRRLVDDGTDCITGAKVVEVSPIGRKWLVKYLTKGGTCAVPTRSVVFATGRAGVNWVAGQLKGLGVPTIQSQPSIGVRFEMSASRLDVAGREHPDLKGSIVTSEGRKAKTFCFCGGRNGGRIKFTHYQSEFDWPIVTLDGHVTSDRPASGTELSGNFGVLTQLKAETSSERMSAFLSSYWLNFHGRPIAQSLQDFSSRRDPARNPLEGLSFSPSVNDFAPGRLDMLFDDFEHKAIVEGFAAVMGGVERGSRAGAMDQDILVLGPEIEFLWDRPVMDATGMVSSAGLWVVGDAAGVAQGIVQAIMFGLAAGAGILNFLNS
jgi:uncharacterized FAD-dependent dehydrogenase